MMYFNIHSELCFEHLKNPRETQALTTFVHSSIYVANHGASL
jgi:hypothetical protein